MEQRTTSPFPRRDRPILAVLGVLLIVPTVLFVRSDRAHDWRYYQFEFRSRVSQKFGRQKAALLSSGLQQIWVPDLKRADRCVTCHQAVGWKGFESADEPFRTHPVELIRIHPVE